MSKIELATTSNAIAVYSQPEALKEKINEWIQTPSTYDDQAQSSFAQSINCYAKDTIDDISLFIDYSKNKVLRSIATKRDRDIDCLKLKLSLIVKSLGYGSLGGLAAAQIATQMTVVMAIASCATPAGWIGGTGTAVVYYQFDKHDQKGKISSKAVLDIEKTNRVAEKLISSLELGSSNTENSRLTRVNEYLHDRNNTLNAQLSGIGRDFRLTTAKINKLQRQNASDLASAQKENRDLINEMRVEFEDRERVAVAKQIVERGIEKAIRRDQEEKILQLSVSLAKKSAAFEVLQSEHDHMSDQIKQRFDIMTQAMSRNPTESSVSELLKSNDQQDVSDADFENNGDFIEVAQEM